MKRKGFITAAAVAAMFVLLGIAGRMDYTEQVVYNMPQEAYDEIRDTLGHDATDFEVAKYYQKNYGKRKQGGKL